MSESVNQDIVQQLMDNATEIISISADDGPERLAVLARRQKRLQCALEDNVPRLGSDVARASIDALQDLVAKAVDKVRTEMEQNRGSMQVTGTRKKVLRAYGTVTVSANPSR
jgi:hypothetical protein